MASLDKRYPHHRSPLRFIPLQHLAPTQRPGEWQASDSEPLFKLEGQLPWAGWNMLEIACDRDVSGIVATLTFESSRRSITIDFPLRMGKTTKRLVFVPWGVKKVTLKPSHVACRFSYSHFRFVWLTPAFAYNRLLQRLVSTHQHYRDMTLDEVQASLKQQARKQSRKWQSLAREDYDSTFISMSTRRHYQQWIQQIEQRRAPDEHEVVPYKSFACSVVVAGVNDQKQSAKQLKKMLYPTLASIAEQSLSPHKAFLLLSPRQHRRLAAWLSEWQHELAFVEIIETSSLSIAQQRSEALQLVATDWVYFLRPGDRLADNALYQTARIAADNPAAQVLVADEDGLDEHGVRHSPQFKPAYNVDFLYSTPYMGRAVCYRCTVLKSSPLAADEENAQNPDWLDYAQLLSITRQTAFQPAWFAHVPHIAYHGAHSGFDTNFVALIKHHFEALGVSTRVSDGLLPGTQRVQWPMPTPEPLVSLLVPTRDGVHILRPCVDALLERTDYTHFELLILDNQSSCKETLAYLKAVEASDSRVRVIHYDHPFNYSSINNFGAAQAKGSIIGLINNDVEPTEGTWLTEMVEQVSRPEIGCVGAKLYYPNDTVQHGGVILGLGGMAGHSHRFFQRDDDGYMGRLKITQNLSAVTAACLLLRKSVFDEVGGLNETHLAVAYNDVDLCIKVREAGYRNLWTPYAALYHHESISRGADNTPEKRARWLREFAYMRKSWGELLDSDPAYNPNLTLVHEDFSLR
ncbi:MULTISPECIES: glycosyltransferase family 2 protein [unclassified Halomonas]|uniref:glycosyltransferase family 2 protein n=1 Tax=unclassified Halomonas TaxID=2609666 RepID=UPI00207681B3|nr:MULTISPECIES: glycosyltransferase family 2 protein [unclassified Halomonas]